MFVGTIELNPAHMDCYRDLRSNIFIKQQETLALNNEARNAGGFIFFYLTIFF